MAHDVLVTVVANVTLVNARGHVVDDDLVEQLVAEAKLRDGQRLAV